MTIIRRATLFDLSTLWNLWVKLTSEECANEAINGREMYPSVVLEDKISWGLETALILTNPEVLYLISETSGEPSGFMLSSLSNRAVGHPKRFLLVHQLYVRPADRRAALGDAAEKLCAATEEWTRQNGVLNVELDCVQSNRARWEKQGFHIAAHRMFKILEEK